MTKPDRKNAQRPRPLVLGRMATRIAGLDGARARHLKLCALIALCFASAPAFGHIGFYPQGWSGLWSNGIADPTHPEHLCGSYPEHTCIVAATHTFNSPLTRWPISVRNNAGLNVIYCTDDRRNRGWIVVIGVTGLSWVFEPLPGTGPPWCDGMGGIRCTYFVPAQDGGIGSVPWNWGGGNYYYQAVFGGTFGGFPCQ
jgi:hypothetical protein